MLTETKTLPTTYEKRQQAEKVARERDAKWRLEMKAMAVRTLAAAEAQEAEERRQQAIAAEESFKAAELVRYLSAGGSELSFSANWPRLRQEIVESRYLAGATASPDETPVQKHLRTLYGVPTPPERRQATPHLTAAERG